MNRSRIRFAVERVRSIVLAILPEGDSPIFVASCDKNRDSPLAAWGFLLVFVAAVFAGCGKSELPGPTGHEGKMVCVDTATKEAMVMPVADTFPAPNPRTGKRTLMPAMYCPKCARWHPVPPPDQINRTPKATTCPKTGTLLTMDGPWPEEPSAVQ